MDQNRSNPAIQQDEISLKELFQRIQGWIKYLFSKWVQIGIIGVVGAAIGFTYGSLTKPNYVAEMTFVLEDGKSSSLGAYAGLASQFGVDLGGGGGSGVFSGDNILEFLRSRLMVEKTLLSTCTIDGKKQTLAETFLQTYDWRKAIDQKPALKSVVFLSGADRSRFTRQQDSVLNMIYLTILKKNLAVSKPDKKNSFILVKCETRNELFSKYFVETLVREATDFYMTTKTQRSKANVDKLQAKADSLENLLNRKTYDVAYSRDLNLNPARSVAQVSAELGVRDKTILQTMYGEVLKNLELSKVTMSQETPIIQIVDTPILPLQKVKFGRLKGIIIGGLLAGFLAIFWILGRRIFKDLMAD